jgi:hypothetical protein
VAGREGKRGSCQTRLIVWRETGASETPVRAASSGVHPEEAVVGDNGAQPQSLLFGVGFKRIRGGTDRIGSRWET